MSGYSIYVNKTHKPKEPTATKEEILPDFILTGLELYPLTKLVPSQTFLFGMEADDDNPFAGMFDGMDLEEEQPIDMEEGDQDNMFDEAEGGDLFADDSDAGAFGDGGERKKEEDIELDREDMTKKKFDISKNVRASFPNKISKLKDITQVSIDIVEKLVVKPENEILRTKSLQNYKKILEIIDKYIDIIHLETYENIFIKYVELWTLLSKQKTAIENLE